MTVYGVFAVSRDEDGVAMGRALESLWFTEAGALSAHAELSANRPWLDGYEVKPLEVRECVRKWKVIRVRFLPVAGLYEPPEHAEVSAWCTADEAETEVRWYRDNVSQDYFYVTEGQP